MRESLSTMTGWVAKRKARFMGWPPIAWFWQIYGVCAMQRTWSKSLVAVAIVSGYWSITFTVELLNPLPVLDKMDRTEGVLLSVYQPRRVNGSSIRIRTADGKILSFRGTIFDKKPLVATKGKLVTVWSQPTYRVWPPFYYQKFWYVEFQHHIVFDHVSFDPLATNWKIKVRNADYLFAKYLFLLMAFSLFVVFLRCRTCDERTIDK